MAFYLARIMSKVTISFALRNIRCIVVKRYIHAHTSQIWEARPETTSSTDLHTPLRRSTMTSILAYTLFGYAEIIGANATSPRCTCPKQMDINKVSSVQATGPTSSERSIRSEAPLGKRLIYSTVIVTAGIDVVCLKYGIAVIDEAGSARLQLEAVDEELEDIGIAVSWVLPSSLLGVSEEVVIFVRSVSRREERGSPAMLLDEIFRNFKHDFCINLNRPRD